LGRLRRQSWSFARKTRGLKDLPVIAHPVPKQQRARVSGLHAELALAALEVLAQELTA